MPCAMSDAAFCGGVLTLVFQLFNLLLSRVFPNYGFVILPCARQVFHEAFLTHSTPYRVLLSLVSALGLQYLVRRFSFATLSPDINIVWIQYYCTNALHIKR